MHSPTEAMIEADDANVVVGCCLSQPVHNREIWQAMINAALGEGK